MSRIIEEPKQHIHSDLCHEVNEMSIRIKLTIAQEKAGVMTTRNPSWLELTELLDRVYREMNQCTKPYKIH